MIDTVAVTNRVIREVAGTIATNGIQELSHDGDMSQFGYVRACLMSTAYNALRAMPGFGESYGGFCDAVLAQVDINLLPQQIDTITEYGMTQRLSRSITMS